jgi:hypothetical protein
MDLPDEVVAAQEQGNLVIFAGAGVSMGPPANLPGFEKLAELISQNTPHPVRKPYDEFLGDLATAGVKVHELCRTFINVAGSAPTPLHLDLVRLFRRPGLVRVVTTNFDGHFTAAAQAAGWTVPIYHAPALPLGHDFHGIVHLHGSLCDEARRIVLTDADFGQAYLTDAWASTFLRTLFAEFVVLFVGYSHTDPPMRYLARGLAGRGTRRYALVKDDDVTKWRSLGIVPVGYPGQEPPDEHGLLGKGVRRWLEITELQPIEIEGRLRTILSAPENIDPNRSETDFLRRSLLRDETAQYVERHATHPRWLDWLHREKLLGRYLHLNYPRAEPVDDEERSRETAQRRIALWAGRTAVGIKSGHGLWLVEQNGGRLGEVAAADAAYRLATDDTIDLADPVAATWVALIIQSPGPPRRADMLGRLLRKLIQKKLWPMALRLFAHCCRTHIVLEPSFRFGDTPDPGTASGRIRLAEGSSYLPDCWKLGFKLALPELAPILLDLLEESVRSAHRLAEGLGQADAKASIFLLTRSQIECSSPYVGESDFSHVITWMSAVVTHLCKAAPGLPPARIEGWISSGNPVLHRIGLHALALAGNMDASGKFAAVRRHALVFTPVTGARHELYALLRSIYGGLTDVERTELWALIAAGPAATPPTPDEDPTRVARQRQGLIDRLVWALHAAHPSDPAAIAAYSALEQRSPDFVKETHEHIDLDYWTSGVRDMAALTPRTMDDLLKVEPAAELDFLLSYRTKDPLGDTRAGLVAATTSAAAKNPAWCMKLMRALAARAAWDSDLWAALFWKINFLDLPEIEQDWVVTEVMAPLSEHDDALNAMTHCLLNGSLFAKEKPARAGLLAALASASLLLWAKVRVAPEADDRTKLRGTDWLGLAINRPPGRIVEFWLRYADYLRQGMDPRPLEWPPTLALCFDQIASAETPADLQGLALIGCHLAFVRSAAPEWTRNKVYPWLNFATAGDRVWPCFHAFVTYGRFNRDLLLELPQLFPAAVGVFGGADEKDLRSFVTAVGIVVYSGLWEVTASGWLRGILLALTEAQRTEFASCFGSILRDVGPEGMALLWARWMRAYWQERLQGRPMLLSPGENGEMVRWVWHLPGAEYAQAAAMLMQGPKPVLSGWQPIDHILETNLQTEAPAALLDLWNWILAATQSYYEDKKAYLNLLAKLPRQPALLPKWEKVCHELSRHGLGFAQELLAAGQEHFTAPPASPPATP